MSFSHEPVLLAQVRSFLALPTARRFIDGTVGGGGHAAAVLEAVPGSELLGLDRDKEALAAAAERLASFGSRVHLVHSRFSGMAQAAAELGWDRADGILLDLGISSHQIDTPERGFAHRQDGPLDMRMDRRERVTAATILNEANEHELARILREYGEEPQAWRIAREIVTRRRSRPWERTWELAELIESVVGKPFQRGLPAATRCFQALRIAVNDELGELAQGLEAAVPLLRPGGRMAVISFHSLEDRLVKNFFRDEARNCVCPPKLPVCVCDHRARLRILTRKPLRADQAELSINRRAAPAHLRVAERVESKRTGSPAVAAGLGQSLSLL